MNRLVLHDLLKGSNVDLIVDDPTRTGWHEAHVSLRGELHAGNNRALDGLRPLIDGGITTLTLDFDGVTRLDFVGLGALIRLLRYARDHGGKILVETSNQHVRGIFEQTALSQVFQLRCPAKAA